MQLNHPTISVEEQFKIIADAAPVLIWLSGEDKGCYFFNAAWLCFTGRTPEQEYGKGWTEGIHPEDLDKYLNTYSNSFDARTEFKIPYRHKHPDGRYSWLLAHGVPRYTPGGAFAGYINYSADISELLESERLKNAGSIAEVLNKEQTLNEELAATNEELNASNEELHKYQDKLHELNNELEERVQRRTRALAASEQNFHDMILQAPIAMGLFKGSDMLLDVINDRFLELWDKDRSVVGKPLLTALPELEGQPYLDIMQQVLKTGITYYGNESKVFLNRHGQIEEGYYNFINQAFHNEEGTITGIIVVANEVTDQVNARKKLERAEESLRTAIDAAELGAYYINAKDRIFETSPRLKEFFGFAPDEKVPYEAAVNQIHPDYRQAVADMVEAAFTKGIRFDMEYPLIGHQDGRVRWVRGIGMAQHDSNGETYLSGVVHEITEKKLEEVRKNDFIGMVSHELKTPLTSLSAIVQVMHNKLKNNEDPFVAGAMEKAGVQVKRMTGMINGFLNISRLESGKILIEKKVFQLDELLREMIEELKLTVTSHKIRLSANTSLKINADRDKISSVISNLISNAVKYSPADTAIYVIGTRSDHHITVGVTDQGIGIQPQDLDKIFERYYQVATPQWQHITGFGIGLYLSKEIIQRHDGQIWVESEPEKGSTFYFSLPSA